MIRIRLVYQLSLVCTVHSQNQLVTATIHSQSQLVSQLVETPSYLKNYTYLLPKLHSSPPITDVFDPQHSLTSFISYLDHVCFTTLCLDSQQLINNVSYELNLPLMKGAILNPAWQMTVTQEFDALYANDTWELVSLPKGKNVVGCK